MPANYRKSPLLLILLIGSIAALYGWTSDIEHTQTTQKELDSLRYLLGESLFFDKRLSVTGTKSCASCHNPEMAFTDGYRKPPGALADLHLRNTPTLLNVSRQNYLNWANPNVVSLTDQMDGPLFGTQPIEMGLVKNDTAVLSRLSSNPSYVSAMQALFPQQGHRLSWEEVKALLAVYVRTLNSFASPYDLYKTGDRDAISSSAKAGEQLFFSAAYGCSTCHRPPTFGADSTMPMQEQFANIGLYNHGNGNYPVEDQGLYQATRQVQDKGKFKIPTLRNLQYTAPYFHDGSAADLGEALAVFEQGGRNVTYGPWQGDGRKNPYKHALIRSLKMNMHEKQALLDFLQSLNDTITYSPKRLAIPHEEI